jgi:hypothetical protein
LGIFCCYVLGFGYSEKLNLANKILMIDIGLPAFLTVQTFYVLQIESLS